MWNPDKKGCRLICLSLLMIILLTVSGCGQPNVTNNAASSVKFPEKEITLIVPLAPGASTDQAARVIAKVLSKYLNKPVVVQNQEGAGGVTATTNFAKTEPDGYTLEFSGDSLFTVQPILKPSLGFSKDDFDFLIGTSGASPTLSVNADSPYKTFEDLIKAFKENGKTINYSHPGVGTTLQLAGQLMFERAGVKSQQIPFTGGSPALSALLGNKVDVLLSTETTILPQVEAGKVRALAVSTPIRSAMFPDVPTLKELGYDGYISQQYFVYAPKGLPEEVHKILYDALQKMVADPEFVKGTNDLGLTVSVMDGKEILNYFEQTLPTMKKLIESTQK